MQYFSNEKASLNINVYLLFINDEKVTLDIKVKLKEWLYEWTNAVYPLLYAPF